MSMTQSIDRISELRTRITRIVREATGMHERLALPIADAICGELQSSYGGSDLYIPAPDKQDRNRAIHDAWQLGYSIDQICHRHQVSRRTVYRLIGRPGPDEDDHGVPAG